MVIDFEREFGVNSGYVESLHEKWREDPHRVEPEWRAWFEQFGTAPAVEAPPTKAPPEQIEEESYTRVRLKGIASKIAANMTQSLEVPTATSARTIPVKVLEENRRILNSHMRVRVLGKASYTHLIAYALVRALSDRAHMMSFCDTKDDVSYKVTPKHVNLGLAVDVETKDGRSLVVPNLPAAEEMDFKQFREAYEDIVRRARENKLSAADFQGTTVTLTNPGGLGTHLSVPRLMAGQGLIIGTGAIGIPTHAEAMSRMTLADLAIGPVMTVTSTYDHRVIQGAESGLLLLRLEELLQGGDSFYEEIFTAMRVPWRPVRPALDQHLGQDRDQLAKQGKISALINAYRSRGCRIADLDPLEYHPETLPSLDPSGYGFTIWDLDREYLTGGVDGREKMTLREILEIMAEAYCRRWTIEYMHISNRKRKLWLRDQVEMRENHYEFDLDERLRVLTQLYRAENFERFLHTRYVGNKRFSLEGADMLIPALARLIDQSADRGIEKVVIGMAHRGRLNVLANILNRSKDSIFQEFEGTLLMHQKEGSGDVKYHVGQSGTYTTASGKQIEVILAPNPSHLEAVDPVVCGMVRGFQDEMKNVDRDRVLGVLIHGDAAFSGQGVVTETLNMSNLAANGSGGTIHIIVNNQIGFTASPKDLRSTYYCTDVAKGIEAPILHANGDYPEAVLRTVNVSVDYHQKFRRDVVIDLVCYRRRGHNEGDEPAYTQPLQTRKITDHPTPCENYVNLLIRRGQMTREEAQMIGAQFDEELRQALDRSREEGGKVAEVPLEELVGVPDESPRDQVVEPSSPTGVDRNLLTSIMDECNQVPEGHVVHPNLLRQLRRREEMARGEQDVDWGTAEALAFGSLVLDGVPIRMNGQDSGRGTFSQRHAVIRDQATGADYVPLNDLSAAKATFEVYDSLLSEEAALAFEFGYSVARPQALTIWEAQFGDFANGAQIPIDNFVASSEAKWQQLSGVTMLLPHGYDGQGPEHSSARIERFLSLCANGNIAVCNCSTSAQYFHLLRRQGLASPKRPLIVFTPKSLLRSPQASSPIESLAEGRFRELLPDDKVDVSKVKRVVVCTGKVYHELDQKRDEGGHDQVAILRMEQLYPFPLSDLEAELKKFGKVELIWCQEEPKNMGAWSFVLQRLLDAGRAITYAGRPACSSPATGSYKRHAAEQVHLVKRALTQVITTR